MGEPGQDSALAEAVAAPVHDHAWRRVRAAHDDPSLLEGSYRCDLCDAVWSL